MITANVNLPVFAVVTDLSSVPRNRQDALSDTTNFSPKSVFVGPAENLHMIERFTRIAADTIDDEVTPYRVTQESEDETCNPDSSRGCHGVQRRSSRCQRRHSLERCLDIALECEQTGTQPRERRFVRRPTGDDALVKQLVDDRLSR